jgi:ferredoxin-NADP reductase/fatty acid desaturase
MSVDVPSPALGPVPSQVRYPALWAAGSKPVRPGGVPDPRIPLPTVAMPTVVLFAGGVVVWMAATYLYYRQLAPLWVTIGIHALVTFIMFTVMHESAHHAAAKLTWVNETLGRLAGPFVAAYASFPLVRYIHLEHHRNTNEDVHLDPDAWTSHGNWWQLPFRWLTIDAWYVRFYASRAGNRPHAEQAESAAVLAVSLAAMAALITAGHGWDLLALYLIPQRVGLGLLSWWFIWLPHHGLGVTQRRDRFGATRVRVGLEWVMSPLMLCQNYHLVHHLHPVLPFYRYSKAWNNDREFYLEQAVPIATAWGRELSASEYRDLRRLTQDYATEPGTSLEPRRQTRFQQLRIDEVRTLTEESVVLTFDVPDRLAKTFRFTAGQHLTVKASVNGQEVRRSYSICAPADSGELRIAVKKHDGGLFSTHATTMLRPGDALEVLPPSGGFTLIPDPRRAHHYVAIAAGSGITPIISMLSTALAAEEHSKVTLLYINRAGVSTMFADELTTLSRRFEGRLHIVHFRTDEQDPDLHKARPAKLTDPISEALAISHERYRRGRLDGTRLRALLQNRLHPAKVDDWFLCGPADLVAMVRKTLADHDVREQSVHFELFCVDTPEPGTGVASRITVDTDATRTVLSTADETILDAALRTRIDVPYACARGACGTCRARLTYGSVTMDANYALSDADVARGQVLTCQSRPATPEIGLTYNL